jgi:hypothetical protein
MLVTCHDLYHVVWGADEVEARRACFAAAAALSGEAFACRRAACAAAADDEAACARAFPDASCE